MTSPITERKAAGHTRLPWAQGEGGGRGATKYVYETNADGQQVAAIASCYHDLVVRDYDEEVANAAFIVRACNSHYELLEALDKCADKFEHYEQLHRLKSTSEGDEKADRNREMADLCRTAIAKARGEA